MQVNRFACLVDGWMDKTEIDSIQQSHFTEANSRSATHDIPHVLCQSKIRQHIQSATTGPCQVPYEAIRALTSISVRSILTLTAHPRLKPSPQISKHKFVSWFLSKLTYVLTPRSIVLLEKLTGSQLVKKFPAFYGTRRIIAAVTSARHLSLSRASSIQSIPPHPTS